MRGLVGSVGAKEGGGRRRLSPTFSNSRVSHQQFGLRDCLLSRQAKLRYLYLSQDMPIKQANEFQAIP